MDGEVGHGYSYDEQNYCSNTHAMAHTLTTASRRAYQGTVPASKPLGIQVTS